jgi:hypothetical protein
VAHHDLGAPARLMARGARPDALAASANSLMSGRKNVPAFSKAAQLRRVDIQTFISREFQNDITQL